MEIEALQSATRNLSAEDAIAHLCTLFPQQASFSTSFGLEDQVITHMIATRNLPVRIFTLDTGRQFAETYSTWNATLEKYKVSIEVFSPKSKAVQQLMREKGPFSFYQSVENRKECCFIRKVEPLQRALQKTRLWITGIRAEQSAHRGEMSHLEWDQQHQLFKFHPLFYWTYEEVKDFVKHHFVPYNPLHDRGFTSIGCQPCTRALQPGEPFRAGRWWWEQNDKKECGLHTYNEPNNYSI
jgi:phosphoadenosine phosphosulfate reductase